MNLCINQVEMQFPEINSYKTFKSNLELSEMYVLKEFMKKHKYITNEYMLRVEGEPYNFFAMAANGKIPNLVDQSIIGEYSNEWVLCYN